jgi:hypothetical protein
MSRKIQCESRTNHFSKTTVFEPRNDKTNIMGLWPAWIQTSLLIRAVWLGSMLFAISYLLVIGFVSEQHGSWSDCVDATAGLDPCWLQTHYVGFVMAQLNFVDQLFITSSRNWHLLEIDFLDANSEIEYFYRMYFE